MLASVFYWDLVFAVCFFYYVVEYVYVFDGYGITFSHGARLKSSSNDMIFLISWCLQVSAITASFGSKRWSTAILIISR